MKDNYYGTLAPKTTGGTATYILDASIGPKPPIEALLAWQEGVAVRSALLNKLYPIDDGRLGLHVKDLFITDATPRHGVGGALMAALVKICQERGYKRLIWTTTHDNEAAIRLYDGFGAERQNKKLH